VCACLTLFALLHAEKCFPENKVSLVVMEREMIALSRGGKNLPLLVTFKLCCCSLPRSRRSSIKMPCVQTPNRRFASFKEDLKKIVLVMEQLVSRQVNQGNNVSDAR